jgi:hypothetical protein
LKRDGDRTLPILPANLKIDLNDSATECKKNAKNLPSHKRKSRENDFDIAEMRAKKYGKHE